MARRKYVKLNKLYGEVPLIYKRNTIYNMCILINALVDLCNSHSEEIESLRKELNETKSEKTTAQGRVI